MKHILIIDDDASIGNLIEELLLREGYRVSRAYSGTEGLLFLTSNRPDLVLLDLMLPGLSGEELLPRLRGIPVIVVSAKVDVDNKVDLLMGGARDYITKPFHMAELLARIAVQLRDPAPTGDILVFEDIRLDNATYGVTVGEKPVRLTKTEFAILKLLLRNPAQVVTKSLILEKISEDTPDCVESSLKVHMSNLRKKLREAGDKDYIEAVWGIGFKLKEG